MVEFRRRHDTGRVFPVRGASVGAMNDLAKQDLNRLKNAVSKQTNDAGNELAITEEGKIKQGALPAIKGAVEGDIERKNDSKRVLVTESNIVKEINKIEHKKNPTRGQLEVEKADINNLKIIHPELADRVLEK